MASLWDIKIRINSVTSTQKITRAMKMVAAAKLRRAQEAIVQARPYAYHMRELVNGLAARAQSGAHPLLRAGGGGKVGIIVITSDRGLCGGFNTNLVNHAIQAMGAAFAGREVELTVVGRKGVQAFKRKACTVRTTHTGRQDGNVMRAAANIIDEIVQDFMLGGTDEVYCLYNEFKSAVQQNVTLERLLPFETPDAEAGGRPLDYLYEPAQENVFDALLMRHLHVQMHRVLHESAASEYGARMTAMDAATSNAGDVIDRLTLQYNRARQGAITTQLIEVISGAQAL